MKPRMALTGQGMALAAGAARRRERVSAYRLEEQVGFLLRRANQRHLALFAEGFVDTGLTPTQFAALVKLRELGPLSQNRLGRLTAMDPATILGVIGRLETRGLVCREADADDGRLAMVRLTEQGQALISRALGLGLEASARTLAPLTLREQRIFLALLEKLV
jgi:MarR family transcriptional regulator, lower aerobic nicotinate degradation pathway regulator